MISVDLVCFEGSLFEQTRRFAGIIGYIALCAGGHDGSETDGTL